jgi:hypothetical protein
MIDSRDTGITLLVFQRSTWAFHKVRWPGFYGQVNQARYPGMGQSQELCAEGWFG